MKQSRRNRAKPAPVIKSGPPPVSRYAAKVRAEVASIAARDKSAGRGVQLGKES